jgi:hypothetical protein
VRHVGLKGKTRIAYAILDGKPEEKGPLERVRRRCEDNNKMDLKGMGCEGVDWIQVAQSRDQWQTLLNMAMKLRVPQKAGNFLPI